MPRRVVDTSDKENGNKRDVPPSVVAEEEGPACLPCRKKKSKCSRSQPCSSCEKAGVECLYDDGNRKLRPGMRIGALDALTDRVKTLEHMFLGQGLLWRSLGLGLDSSPTSDDGHSLKQSTEHLKTFLSSLNNGETNGIHENAIAEASHKRRRISKEESKRVAVTFDPLENALPDDDLVDDLVEIYFVEIHPWIPILHVKQFRERMRDPIERPKLKCIFHAIVSLCSRFSNDPRLSAGPEIKAQYARKNRQIVILQSMESFSVENLQALVICAFDTIGSGRGPSAWSIVGSMTRTVEQLQLSVEESGNPGRTGQFMFMQRMAFLKPCKSWLEQESRRRVFWTIFLMDRFCSVATGWNVSLTSADVKRRLPCEGKLWERGLQTTEAPFFGITDGTATTPKMTTDSRPDKAAQDSIGAFAYCIEATESLSLVTNFFLHQPVDLSNYHDVQIWMMRFKELDLRLIQWKLFLPEQWRNASARNVDGILDPNLILAHITHNTAVGLLHQGIAYPSPQWQRTKIKLPSASSAETCLTAASEIAIIAKNFLLGSTILTNPQFAFCLFISGRMLLAHSNYYNTILSEDFDSLTDSLLEISRRWNGSNPDPFQGRTENLASKFAARLIQAKNEGAGALDIRKAAYSEEGQRTAMGSPQRVENEVENLPPQILNTANGGYHPYPIPNGQTPLPESTQFNDQSMHNPQLDQSSPDSISLAFPPLPLSFQPQNGSRMASPAPEHQMPPNAGYPSNMDAYGADISMNLQPGYGEGVPDGFGSSMEEYANLNTFFQYPFIPSQRISSFMSVEKDKEM